VNAIDPANQSFTMISKQYGTQKITTTPLTIFKKSKTSSSFNQLQLGTTTTIKGTWERDKKTINAKEVATTFRLLNIDFTGVVKFKTDTGLTVAANGGVLY
jgi:hypothetical protein